MHYAEIAPPEPLRDHIECFWSLSGDAEANAARATTRVFPDGCIELIVHLGTPWSWRPEDGELRVQPTAFVVGQLTRPLHLEPPARGGHAFGARFRPGGAAGIVADALEPLTDTVTPLATLWGAAEAQAFAARLLAAAEDATRAATLAGMLSSRAAGRKGAHPAIRTAVEAIFTARGSLRVAPLARASGWGERQFERRFAREVGCTPRTLARTVRFQQLLALVGRDERVDWAGLAWDSGFADQAHLIREFRRFTGATPGSFADEALALARRFVTPERLSRYFRDEPSRG